MHQCAVKGAFLQRVQVPPGTGSLHPAALLVTITGSCEQPLLAVIIIQSCRFARLIGYGGGWPPTF
jgi:hypothetical protein